MVTNVAGELSMLKSQIKIRIAEYEFRAGKKLMKKDAAKHIGMLPQQFSALIAGTVFTTSEKLFKLANLLGCKVDDLYEYTEEEGK